MPQKWELNVESEIEARIELQASRDCCWRVTFKNGAQMTIYRPRELAMAEAKRYGKVIKTERRVNHEWVEA